jgi:hypothetical protein
MEEDRGSRTMVLMLVLMIVLVFMIMVAVAVVVMVCVFAGVYPQSCHSIFVLVTRPFISPSSLRSRVREFSQSPCATFKSLSTMRGSRTQSPARGGCRSCQEPD